MRFAWRVQPRNYLLLAVSCPDPFCLSIPPIYLSVLQAEYCSDHVPQHRNLAALHQFLSLLAACSFAARVLVLNLSDAVGKGFHQIHVERDAAVPRVERDCPGNSACTKDRKRASFL
jgi:hypothetical protein